MTVVLTVKSGMDPYMINWDTRWYGNGLDRIGLVQLKYCQVGAGDSLLCYPVGVGDFLSCCPVGVGGSLLRCLVGVVGSWSHYPVGVGGSLFHCLDQARGSPSKYEH
jgi:hypothetical protein